MKFSQRSGSLQLALALAALTAWCVHADLRTSANYSQPFESLNAGGGTSSSGHYSTLNSLGVPGGAQTSARYTALGGLIGPLFGDTQGPALTVHGNGLFIGAGDVTPAIEDGTDFGRRGLLAPAQVHTFTLRNEGTESTELATLTVTGANAMDFSAGGLALPLTLAPGGAADFTVTFRPFSAGRRTTTVRITSSTPGLGAYEFAVQGLAQGEIFVTNTDDSGTGSLRQAILIANAQAGENVILFGPAATGVIPLLSALPEITESLSLNGPGASVLTVRRGAAAQFRLFNVAAGFNGALSFSGLTLKNGRDAGGGAVLLAGGSLAVSDCVFEGNTSNVEEAGSTLDVSNGATLTVSRCAFNATDNLHEGGLEVFVTRGAAISAFRAGPVSVTDSRFSTSAAYYGAVSIDATPAVISRCVFDGNSGITGGAMYCGANTPVQPVLVEDSLFQNNYATSGGAINNRSQNLRLVNCTFTGNGARQQGGALMVGYRNPNPLDLSGIGGRVEVANCTLTRNWSSDSGFDNDLNGGGGIAVAVFGDGTRAYCELRNTVVAGNEDRFDRLEKRPDVRGIFDSRGWNFIGDASGAAGWVAGDQTGSRIAPLDAKLSDPADFGGPTLTCLPLAGSPLIDHGNVAGLGLTHDQRGLLRLVDDAGQVNGAGSDGSDIGAVEAYAPPGTAPRFIVQPADLTVERPGQVRFEVATYGSGPLSYQWRHGGVPVDGATGPVFTLARLNPSVAGNYDVVVSSPFGNATSRTAVLTVNGNFVVNLADSGSGSLREQIIAANNRPGPDTIILAADAPGRILLETALPNLTGALTIVGPGSGLLTLERTGAGTFGAFNAPGTITDLVVSGLAFRNFNGPDGTIYLQYGNLTVSDCVFDANQSSGSAGIHVREGTQVTVTRCAFTGNVAGGYGGALRLTGSRRSPWPTVGSKTTRRPGPPARCSPPPPTLRTAPSGSSAAPLSAIPPEPGVPPSSTGQAADDFTASPSATARLWETPRCCRPGRSRTARPTCGWKTARSAATRRRAMPALCFAGTVSMAAGSPS